MAKSIAWLLAIVILICSICSIGQAAMQVEESGMRSIPLRAQSLHMPYLDSDMQSRYFEFGEDTIIRADKYIRLTADRQGQTGWLFARTPMTATSWQIEVEFVIHGNGHLHGDGMAIWLTEDRGQTGKVFGSRDRFTGLGIFIDTYKNDRPGVVFPYVMAMMGNSSVSYDKEHDGKANELAGCSARGVYGDDNPPTKRIRMTYVADTSFKVELQYRVDHEDQWTDCFETGPIKLPSTYYLGLSAETGDLSDNHDIIGITSSLLHASQSTGPGKAAYKSHPYNPGGQKERGSWRWFFLKLVLVGVLLVVGYVGWTVYRTNKRSSRF